MGVRPNDPVAITLPILDWQALPRPILTGGEKASAKATASAHLRNRVDIDRMFVTLSRKVTADNRLCSITHKGGKGYVVKVTPWTHMSQYRIEVTFKYEEEMAGIIKPSNRFKRGVVYKGDVGVTDKDDAISDSTCHVHADAKPDNVLALLQTAAALGLQEIDFQQGIFQMIPASELRKPTPERRPWGVPPGRSTEEYIQDCLEDLGLAGFAEKQVWELPP